MVGAVGSPLKLRRSATEPAPALAISRPQPYLRLVRPDVILPLGRRVLDVCTCARMGSRGACTGVRVRASCRRRGKPVAPHLADVAPHPPPGARWIIGRGGGGGGKPKWGGARWAGSVLSPAMVKTRACVVGLRSCGPSLRPDHAKPKEFKSASTSGALYRRASCDKRFYAHSQRLGGSGGALGPECARLVQGMSGVVQGLTSPPTSRPSPSPSSGPPSRPPPTARVEADHETYLPRSRLLEGRGGLNTAEIWGRAW
jgi:hypothetical protein